MGMTFSPLASDVPPVVHGRDGRARSRQVTVPEGWVVVPADPTPEMLRAGRHPFTVGGTWKAMLAVAPKPPR